MKKLIYSFLIGILLLVIMPWQVLATVDAEPTLYVVTEQNNQLPTNILIKSNKSSTVYWYGDDGKRYVFPNENTYKTWFADYDFVNEISNSQMSEIPLGGNVTYRAGSRLVKIQTDPKVYTVGPNGYLHGLADEEVARQLYGENWADLVDDLPVTLFTNYKMGDNIIEPFYVDGTVVRYGEEGNTYIIENGKKRQIMNKETMNINHLLEEFVFEISESMIYENADRLLGSEKIYNDLSQSLKRWDGSVK